MDTYIVVLRVIHIVAGVFWVGSTMLFALFIEPTVAALGSQGGTFMTHLTKVKKYPIVIALTSIVAIVAGGLLYWRSSGGLSGLWIQSGPGLTFTVGGALAVIAWLIGFTVLRPTIGRMEAIRLSAPSEDSRAATTMAALQRRLRLGSNANLILLIGTVTAMAAARYV